ncbi:MAG: hypothetical protein AAF597_02495, partial [Bacteroidota bacterium]
VLLNLTATDDCGISATTVTVDEDAVDRNGDNVVDAADFRGEYDIPSSRFTGNLVTGLEAPVRNLPIGMHLARIKVVDDCGNEAAQVVMMRVTDGRPPAPICISAVSVDLVPDVITGGINTVWASDFVGSPAVTCTETNISYALYREEEAAVQGFIPQENAFNVEVDCADLGPNILRLYAFAENTGLTSFCNVVLTVTDNNSLCTERMGAISGMILDRNGDPMRNVEVFNDGPSTLLTLTEDDGSFLFDGLEEQVDYRVQPYLNANPVNGISTADLNVIGRRLLGVDDNLTPYQLIAADANNNGTITIRDLIAIREVLLGFQDDFENNTSWRFLLADYNFLFPSNPWSEVFPETAAFPDLNGAQSADFIAIKVGDVTGNAEPHFGFTSNEDGGSVVSARLSLRPTGEEDVWGLYAPGMLQHATGSSGAVAGAGDRITAVQGALQLPDGVRLLSGQLSQEEYRIDKDNVLRFSRVAMGERLNNQVPLLRFTVVDGALPELLEHFPSFPAEAYTANYQTLRLGLTINHSAVATIPTLTATPSPFSTSTQLRVDWPSRELISLFVYDAAGRVIHQRDLQALAGPNQWELTHQELGGQAGVYLVRVQGATEGKVLRVVMR